MCTNIKWWHSPLCWCCQTVWKVQKVLQDQTHQPFYTIFCFMEAAVNIWVFLMNLSRPAAAGVSRSRSLQYRTQHTRFILTEKNNSIQYIYNLVHLEGIQKQKEKLSLKICLINCHCWQPVQDFVNKSGPDGKKGLKFSLLLDDFKPFMDLSTIS